MPTSLESAILKAITYFDLFSYPLTPLEIWKHVSVRGAFSEVQESLLRSTWLKERLEHAHGMYFLKGRADILSERNHRYRFSKHKMDRARAFARWMRFIPTIEAVFACNSLGFLHSKEESDIDLLVLTGKGTLWTSRFFAVLVAKCFGRPTKTHAKDGICLSFFATVDAHLELLKVKDDIYLTHWMNTLLPIFIRGNSATTFWRANSWIQALLPQAEPIISSQEYCIKKGIASTLVGKVIGIAEPALKWFQLRLLPKHLLTMMNKGTSVVVNDEVLKFHDHDRRDYVKAEYEKSFAERSATL